MRELFQCIFCTSLGFMTATLLAANKNHSSDDIRIDNSTKSEIVSEAPAAKSFAQVTEHT